jgi:hypothetical protein
MKENEWEDDDVKEFARLVEQSKWAWKPTKKSYKQLMYNVR